MAPEEINRICVKIDSHLQARDTYDEATDPVPSTFTRAYWPLAGAIAAFVVSTLGASYAYTLNGSWTVWGMDLGAELLVGIVVARVVPRVIRTSWFSGIAVVAVLAGASLVLS